MKERNLVLYIVISLVTCGLFALYWFITLTDDAKMAANDTQLASGGMALLFTIITCGIYGIYWAYKMGKLMEQAQKNYGLPAKDNSVLYLILEILGLGIVVYALVQNDLNTIATMGQNTQQGAA